VVNGFVSVSSLADYNAACNIRDFSQGEKNRPIGYTKRKIKERGENRDQLIKQVMREGKMVDFTKKKKKIERF